MLETLTSGTRFETVREIIESFPVRADNPAIEYFTESGREVLCFRDVESLAARLAGGLRSTGIGRGDYVVLLLNNRPEWIVACMAVIEAGAIVVPLDFQSDDDTIEMILRDIDARAVFTTAARAERMERTGAVDSARVVLFDADDEEARSWRSLLSEPIGDGWHPQPDDVAAVFFTSGTTGTPKGVPLTHRNLIFQINAMIQMGLVHEGDRFLTPLPLHHIYPFSIGMLLPLACGRPVVIPGSLTGPQLMRTIHEGQISVIIGVPRLYEALANGIQERLDRLTGIASLMRLLVSFCVWSYRTLHLRPGRTLLSSLHERIGPRLRLMTCGGASINPEVASKLEALGWEVTIGYGLSETAPLLTIMPPGAGRVDTVGAALPGVELRIDRTALPSREESGEISGAEQMEAGEIQALGPGVFSGYLNHSSKEVFTEDGWFRTGDFGYFDNGYLRVLGRLSSVIVSETGKKIDPEELEQQYMTGSYIKEIGILSRAGKLVAVIVPDMEEIQAAGEPNFHNAIHDDVDRQSMRLPGYKRLSGYVISREPLSRTAMGKIQRHKLSGSYDRIASRERKPAPSGREIQKMSRDDLDLIEHPAGRQVWQHLSDAFASGPLSMEANPQLDLGIDSLEWLSLSLTIRESTGVTLNEEVISKIKTVRDLMREIVRKYDEGSNSDNLDPFSDDRSLLSDEQLYWLSPLSPLERLAQTCVTHLVYAVVRLLFRLRVEGSENIQPGEQYVFTPNHASYVDAFVLGTAMGHRRFLQTHWAGWTGIAFANSLARLGSRLGQAIPINSDRALVSSLALGAAVLKTGKSLVWFPEGRRTMTGELLEFKSGIGVLLDRVPVRVIPVYLEGTAGALPPGSWMVRPFQVTVRFGAPQEVAELRKEGTGSSPEQRIASAIRQQVGVLAAGKATREIKSPAIRH